MTREDWLQERKKGIGGSDAATVWGLNKYKTNVRLWEEKTGKREAEDISDKPCIIYGTQMESILRDSFKIKHPEFEVSYQENTVIKHPKYPFLFASLDGQLVNKESGEMGILEIKTSDVNKSRHYEDWKGKIPDNYYLQCLHYMNVTGYTFVILFAELKIRRRL